MTERSQLENQARFNRECNLIPPTQQFYKVLDILLKREHLSMFQSVVIKGELSSDLALTQRYPGPNRQYKDGKVRDACNVVSRAALELI